MKAMHGYAPLHAAAQVKHITQLNTFKMHISIHKNLRMVFQS